ncbi:hypothetical protein KSF_100640 [Reticulibacter mediterranei]|uniref:HAMP domain-containing protein n=1 Tax=Reticulibacter mediterranei TaxID=2778369 RepID=A0A8J3ISK3_9CHLR|nr:hypothetical protein [Reticulibacter mediterranei]GHP00017.1 hypothetical protein KSF_100640 [Reticulibacter mediterranei]
MEQNNTSDSDEKIRAKTATNAKWGSSQIPLLSWWYRLVTPLDPPKTASLAQREKIRHARLAALTVPLFMLYLLTLLPQAISSHGLVQILLPLEGEIICVVALLLNRRGWIQLAGILLLTQDIVGLTFSLFTTPGGLTLNNLYRLDFTIVPDILALSFFSANILFLIFSITALQAWILITYTQHDQVMTYILQTNPFQVFSHIYALQLITVTVLYLWARSTELAIKRADRAEEIATFERHEKELREKELEQKRQLDVGIQQILQTHVAVANGDFTVRAPLSQDHVLWQVAKALNNLIARIQRLSSDGQKFKPYAWREDELTSNEHGQIPYRQSHQPKDH